jgi:hypothetical protein
MSESYIRIEEWVTEHAQKAYDKKNYIEAIQSLHGWIQNKLQELLILTGCVDYKSDMSKVWDIANEIDLLKSAQVLFILSQITEKEYQMIRKFNKMRNIVIHKIYLEPYSGQNNGVSKKLFDEAFRIGIKLSDLLQTKTAEKIE